MTDAAALTGTELRAARRGLGLSQEQLAARLGVSFATVNRWERGRVRPRSRSLEGLAAVLALSHASAGAARLPASTPARLDAPERAVLEDLAAFPGAFGLEAAEAVAAGTSGAPGSMLVRLGSLAARSLLDVEPGVDGPRYRVPARILEALQPGAPASAAAATRLSDWVADFVRRAERGMSGRDQDRWLRIAALEADTVATAIERAVAAGDAARAIELAGGFWRYWYSVSDLKTGRRLLDAALAARGSTAPSQRARALHGAGVIARQQGDRRAAVAFFHENLAVAQASGDDRAIAQAHNSLAGALHQSGNVARARELLLASLAWWERVRDRDGMAAALSNLGVVASDAGDLDAAREFGEQALALRVGLGHSEGIAISCENLATVALRAGDPPAAARLFREALRRYAAMDELDGIASTLDGLVLVLPDDLAVRVLPAANRLRARLQVPREADMSERLASRMGQLPASAGSAPQGDPMPLELAIELALAGTEATEPLGRLLRRRLTVREREVLALVTAGWTSKEVAARLGRSVRTVEHQLSAIYSKIGARGRADAIAFGVRMGL